MTLHVKVIHFYPKILTYYLKKITEFTLVRRNNTLVSENID